MIDYQKIIDKVLSYSSLKEFMKSPEHFVQYLEKKKAPSEAMIFGSLLDRMILTPGTWQDEFTVMPHFDRRTKEGKEGFAKFAEENKGKTFVEEDQIVKAEFITAKVMQNEQAIELLSRITQTQETIFYTDKETGLRMIAKLDGRGEDIIFDLKSCASADPDDFIKAAINFNYPLQAAVYTEAVRNKFFKFPDYYFLCVETSAPYGISVCKAGDDFIELGKQQLRKALDQFKYCLDNKLFHQSYEFKSLFGPRILELPAWAKKGLEE